MSESGDRSSMARKRALRRLAREQRAIYRGLYTDTRPRTQTHDQARGQALTLLRYRYPDRYLELYAQERVAPGTDVPPEVRSKAWQKASGALADLLDPAYRELFQIMRARGLNNSCAYDMAIAQLRDDNQDLFTRVLADEIRCCLSQAQEPGTTLGCHKCGGTSWRPGRHLCAEPCGQVHRRCLDCGAATGECYWACVRSAIDLLTAQAPTVMAAFLDAIRSRRPPESCPACASGRPCRRHAGDRELAEQYRTVAAAIQHHLAALAAPQNQPPCTVPPNPQPEPPPPARDLPGSGQPALACRWPGPARPGDARAGEW